MPITTHLMNETRESANLTKLAFTSIFTHPWAKVFLGIILALFGSCYQLIHILLALVVFDMLSGFCVAIKNKTLSSYGYSRAIWKVIAYVFTIFAVRLMEMGAMNDSIAFTTMLIGILCITEAVSILENAILLGVPLPKSFLDLLTKHERYQNKIKRLKKEK